MTRLLGLLTLSLGLGVLAAGLGGCIGYSTWPPAEGKISLGDPNGPQMAPIMGGALKWAIENNPSGDSRTPVVNGPTGLRPHLYNKMADLAGAEPLTPANADRPTYHIVRVMLRGSQGQVDLLAPNPPGSESEYTPYTLWMKSSGGLWTVDRYREWYPGTFDVPPLYYLPGSDAETPTTYDEAVYEQPELRTDAPESSPPPAPEPQPAREPAALPPGVYEIEPG